MQEVPLKQLTPNETKEFTLDLVKDLANIHENDDKKSRGQLVLELTFNPFKFETTESFKSNLDRKPSSLKGSEFDDDEEEEPSFESGVLIVTIIEALNVEGEHHTNPHAQIILNGEKRKTQLLAVY
ncbi:Synaptotagmin-3 [Bienertia sinuspersici]